MDIQEDPTRPMRRTAIQNSIARVKAILKSVGKSDVTPHEIAEEAHLRIERAKTVPTTEHAGNKVKRSDSE